MKTAKLGALFLVSVMALAGTGAAYACWWDYLYLDGYVETGYMDVEWSVGTGWDTEPVEKDYSYIVGDPAGDTLYVYVYNAYPCIDYYLPIDVHNTGTIPIHFRGLFGDGGELELYGEGTVEVIPDPEFPDAPLVLDAQIHPDEAVYGLVHIHLEQSALQDYDYDFEYELVFSNWNCDEDPII